VSSEPLLNERELKASLLNGSGAEAAEKTAAGSLIGCVRDLVSGKASNPGDAQDRARTNDMIGEVAADTFAMMPGVSWLKAGGIRAALMLNPHADLMANAQIGAVNFAEGVALNKVSKFSGQALHDPMASRSLMSESVGLFKFGAGMGTVKAVFNEGTWTDKNGNFQLGDGIANVAKAGTIGGVIGVPAGMAGNRIAKLGLTQFAESGINPRAMSVGLGMVSGYPAGAIFGGVDSVMHGAKPIDVLKSAHEGGLVGMFAGGLTGGFVRNDAIPTRATRGVTEHEPLRATETSMNRSEKVGGPPRMYDWIDNVEIKQPRDLAENLRRLGDYRQFKLQVDQARLQSDDIAHSSSTFEEFARRARTTSFEQSRIYTVNGVDIHIPESYAKVMDNVYQLRMTQERGFHPDATPLEKQQAIVARHKLKFDPRYTDRAHPADIAAMFDQLPDRSLIKRVEILDSDYYADAWSRKTYKPDFTTAATAANDGTMTFYKVNQNADLNRIVHHEWAHFLENAAKRDRSAFDAAAALEANSHSDRSEKGFMISDYAGRDVGENWAEHSSALTKAETTDFFETAHEAPIRTAILGKALAKSLNFVPQSQRSPYMEQLSARVRYIDEAVLPRAQSLLEGYLMEGKPAEQIQAATLLREIGTKKHFELLKDVAKNSKHPEVAEASFDAARSMAFYGREMWSGYNTSSGANTTRSYTDFLVDVAQPGSKSRGAALEYLEPLSDARSEGYYALLTHGQKQHLGDQISSLFEAMRKIPELEPKQQALDIARRLAGNDPMRQYGLDLSVFQQVPALKEAALRHMINIDPVKTEPILEAIAKKPTHRLNALAKEGLAEIDALAAFKQLERQLTNGNPEQRSNAMIALGKSGELRAIEPLLKRVAYGASETERAQAQHILDTSFTRQIVKAEVHRMIRVDNRWYEPLRRVVERQPLPLAASGQ
jgi:hypothetical protein